jgi:tetratricopeptide (TPR) repeat protein/transcriptional regulator with XRE-family HTH domain
MHEKQAKTRLQREREKRNLTQAALAELIEGTPKTVSRWELGKQSPSLFQREKLAKVFEMAVDDSWFRPENDEEPALSHWYVPYDQNPCFTDHRDRVTHLRERLLSQEKGAGSQSISGLGGIGKTQLVLQYAYQYRDQYNDVFWVNASTQTQLINDFVQIANLLQLPEAKKSRSQPRYLVNEVIHWFQTHQNWLLICDNVEESVGTEKIENLEADLKIDRLLSLLKGGHILLTTRSQKMATLAQNTQLEEMSPEEGAQLLLLPSKQQSSRDVLNEADVPDREAAIALSHLLGGLPLALEQARAYIESTRCGFQGYMQLYEEYRSQILQEVVQNSLIDREYKESVATTWLISFQHVQRQLPVASDVLKLYAYLAPDAIPENIVLKGAEKLDERLRPLVGDLFLFNRVCQILLNYSLIKRNTKEATHTIHRLVQAVLQDSMDHQEQVFWAQQAVYAVEHAFSDALTRHQKSEQYMVQAYRCSTFIKKLELEGQEVTSLLEMASRAVSEQGWYALARPLSLQALGAASHSFEQDNIQVLNLLMEVGRIHLALGIHPALAVQTYTKAATNLERLLGPDHPDVLACLNELMDAQMKAGDYSSASRTCVKALSFFQKTHQPPSAEQAKTYHMVAEFYAHLDQGNFAEDYYRRAYMLLRDLLGPNHPSVADVLMDVGVFYLVRKKLQDAESALRQALDIRKRTRGDDHPDTAMSLMRLGLLSWEKKSYEEAEEDYLLALQIIRKKLGPYHPDILQCLHDLAVLSTEQGKADEAEQYLREALTLAPNAGGTESGSYFILLDAYAECLQMQGRLDEAQYYKQQSSDLYKRLKEQGPLESFALTGRDGTTKSGATMWFLPHDRQN